MVVSLTKRRRSTSDPVPLLPDTSQLMDIDYVEAGDHEHGDDLDDAAVKDVVEAPETVGVQVS